MLRIITSNETKKKLQWLQDLSEINENNLNNIRCKARRHFRNKRGEYLKDKIKELETNIKNKNKRPVWRNKLIY
jgi:hypothetical protein